ncbi:MAG: thiamine-phosphate kinase, partial [Pseudomonadota bacterium]
AKLLTVNLSDLAAMGARPHTYLLTLALPTEMGEDWLSGFVTGLARVQERWGIALVGGDSVSIAGPVCASITAMGTVPTGDALLRSGAHVGDDVYVTGSIGGGVLGLMAARGELDRVPEDAVADLKQRYDAPTPRGDVGQSLIGVASAAVDVSDGLLADLGHIARASGVGISLRAEAIPLSPAAMLAISVKPELKPMALSGGDDYELAFTAPASRAAAIQVIAERCGLAITKIGETISGSDVTMLDGNGAAIATPAGWQHF